ncbi:hypothetical protein DCMF_13545 [Candidatus Formimonas warabiya]|uniref:AAA domain-containing protein n=2 Tax=Formimonas warabiya TaxID=1761012 RepID=A0A3G1L1S1_FORW1|nr:hypothetical protein DCMF_13545 [Candidatus Formimonas warabiya]
MAQYHYKTSESVIKGPRTIAVTSGKGGVGKTNVVVNLAVQLGKMGKKVVILDADIGLANTEVLLGMVPDSSIYDVFTGEKTIAQIAVDGPFDVKLIPGGTGFRDIAHLEQNQIERISDSLNKYVEGYDYFFIDTGAGISKSVLGFIAAAQEVIVVATPEPTSLTDAYSMIKILAVFKIHSSVHLIVNRAVSSSEANQTRRKMDMVTGKFLQVNINHLGCIYEDQYVAKAVKNQQPFVLSYPNSTAAQNIREIASSLLNVKEEKVDGVSKLIKKLIHLFG